MNDIEANPTGLDWSTVTLWYNHDKARYLSTTDLLTTNHYIMAGRAIVVAKDITLLFYHGNAVILTLW